MGMGPKNRRSEQARLRHCETRGREQIIGSAGPFYGFRNCEGGSFYVESFFWGIWVETRAFSAYFFALASGLSMFYFGTAMEVEPVYVIAIVTLVPLALFAMQKWPLLILVGLTVRGRTKNLASGGNKSHRSDYDLSAAFVGAIFWEILLMLAPSARSLSFSALFQGASLQSACFSCCFCAAMAISLVYTRSEQGAMKSRSI